MARGSVGIERLPYYQAGYLSRGTLLHFKNIACIELRRGYELQRNIHGFYDLEMIGPR
jgi:hypothetical protein